MRHATQELMDRNDDEVVFIHLKKETKLRLIDLSVSMGRVQDDLIEEAVANYCDYQAWKFEAIEEGIRDANAGLLSSTAEVRKRLEEKRALRMQQCNPD